MSSRADDRRRRDRSWERDERERDRNYPRGGRGGGAHRSEGRRRPSRSRSRSPPRRGERDRRGGSDRRDYGRDDRRDKDRRDTRRRDDGRERDYREDRGDKRETPRKDEEKDGSRRAERPSEPKGHSNEDLGAAKDTRIPSPRPEPSSHDHPESSVAVEGEDGEDMEVTNEDDAAMMAMMGLSGFGTTKGKPVEGNQEGGVSVKKMRTWRQYMNRRGGFNRPLDKIK